MKVIKNAEKRVFKSVFSINTMTVCLYIGKKEFVKMRYLFGLKSLFRMLRDLIKLRKFLLCSVGAVLLCTVSAYGTEYYVSPIGNDSNSGALASPWKTIAKANATLKAGDTVFLRDGKYDEQISPVNSGELGRPIYYKAFPGEDPVIDRSRLLVNWRKLQGSIYWTDTPPWAFGVWEDTYEISGNNYFAYWPQDDLEGVNGPGKCYFDYNTLRVYVWTKNGDNPSNHVMRTAVGHGVAFSSKDYIVVDGINIQRVKYAVKVKDSSFCVFKNLTVKYASDYGMRIYGECQYNQIVGNSIFYVGAWLWRANDGIYFNGHHNLVAGNEISVVGHNAIASRGDKIDTYFNIIQNNKVHNCKRSGLNSNIGSHREVWRDNISYKNGGGGMQNDSNNNIIRGNIFYKNGLAISIYATGGRTISGNKVYNNTFYDNSHEYAYEILVADWGGTCDHNIFKNNISYKSDVDFVVDFDSKLRSNLVSCNDLLKADGSVPARALSIGTNTLSWWHENYPANFVNNLQSKPLFTNPSASEFTLQKTSPLIDKGCFPTGTTSSGIGNVISVVDVGYFCDGFGIVDGDLIQLKGSSDVLKILKVDYEKNEIHVDREVSWEKGAGVSLPYSGSAPDIGTSEYLGVMRAPVLQKIH